MCWVLSLFWGLCALWISSLFLLILVNSKLEKEYNEGFAEVDDFSIMTFIFPFINTVVLLVFTAFYCWLKFKDYKRKQRDLEGYFKEGTFRMKIDGQFVYVSEKELFGGK